MPRSGRKAAASTGNAAAAEDTSATAEASAEQCTLPEPPEGWTRYWDPGSERTYLYCEASGDWHFEDLDQLLVEEAQPAAPSADVAAVSDTQDAQFWPSPSAAQPARGGRKARKGRAATQAQAEAPDETEADWERLAEAETSNRPPPPPVPHGGSASTVPVASPQTQEQQVVASSHSAAAFNGGQMEFASENPEVAELAKQDQIVRELVRDEMKLRKKLREIEALESSSAAAQKSLEASQVAKLAKKGSILSDLQVVKDQILEALQDFKRKEGPACRPTAAGSFEAPSRMARPAPKAASQKRPQVAAVNPLPQRGKAPMPVNPSLAVEAGNSASRLAAFAPTATVPVRPATAGYGAQEAPRPPAKGMSMADYLGYPAPEPLPPPLPRPVPKGRSLAPGSNAPEPVRVQWQAGLPTEEADLQAAAMRPAPPPVPAAAAFCEEDVAGFVEVRRANKARQAPKAAAAGRGAATGRARGIPGQPPPAAKARATPQADEDDDAFW